jgi:hypothetical protein
MVAFRALIPWASSSAFHGVYLAGNESSIVDRTHHAARIRCLRVFFAIADDLKRLSCSIPS